jgi:hypothetical protein
MTIRPTTQTTDASSLSPELASLITSFSYFVSQTTKAPASIKNTNSFKSLTFAFPFTKKQTTSLTSSKQSRSSTARRLLKSTTATQVKITNASETINKNVISFETSNQITIIPNSSNTLNSTATMRNNKSHLSSTKMMNNVISTTISQTLELKASTNKTKLGSIKLEIPPTTTTPKIEQTVDDFKPDIYSDTANYLVNRGHCIVVHKFSVTNDKLPCDEKYLPIEFIAKDNSDKQHLESAFLSDIYESNQLMNVQNKTSVCRNIRR